MRRRHADGPRQLALVLAVFLAAGMPARGDAPNAAPPAASAKGPAAQAIATIEDLLKVPRPQHGALFAVRGYRRDGDQGGGLFRYRSDSAVAADEGTVFRPKAAAGRFHRLPDPRGEVYAEWFGAYGDGDSAQPHDDQVAINACLKVCGRVRLRARTYGVRGKPSRWHPDATYHAIDLGPNYCIEGTDRATSRIKLLDGTNPHGDGPWNNYFSVLANRDFYESADDVVIRNLTVDGNFDRQDRATTIHAISIRGGGALVEHANFRGYGTGRHPQGSSRECFVVNQTLVYKAAKSSRKAATYRDLDLTDPGHNGSLAGPVAEITHLALGGANNFHNLNWILPRGADPDWDPAGGGENEKNWWPSVGGLVEDCVIHNERFDPRTQKSPLNGITYGDCAGMVVRNNRVSDFEGAAVYVMSWWNRNTLISNNQFLGVVSGVALQMKTEGGKPLQAPRHENVVIERNTIKLCAPPHYPWSPTGVQLYGHSFGQDTRMKDIVVRENTIEGRAYADARGKRHFPTGIAVQSSGGNYRGLRFEDNRIETPDFAPTRYVPQEAHSMSLFYFPLSRWQEDARAGSVTYKNNRNRAGQLLRPMLVDWSFNNPPAWGDR